MGLVCYAISTGAQALGFLRGWDSATYRWWYLAGACYVAAFLGMGSLYLLAPRWAAHCIMAGLAVGCLMVAPMILLYAAVARQNAPRHVFAPPGWFLAGYLLAWIAFATAATLLQWLLEWQAVVTPMMAGTSRVLGGVVLLAAGIYQWLPLKYACLDSCRAPLSFVQRHGGFQPSARGSLRLGVLHGFYCIGCCWVLMLLLFAFGVMNLTWIAGLMLFVLLEKLLPWPVAISRLAGVGALAAGGWLIST